jgi:hypothetical protein
MRIFISSTFVDLRAERESAVEALRRSQLVPWGMELFVSEPSSPLDVCLRELRLSDAVVLIIGFYAGSLIPEAHGLTYTGAEFHLAQQLGRPVFAFFKTDGGKPLNKETDAEKQKALDDFRGAVRAANITASYFDTPERLQVELLLAMEKWNAEGRPGSRFVFTTPKEFFAQFESDTPRLFDFKQTLRGRDTQIAAFNTFLADPASVVGVLAGRGGIGKSKLLHDWALTVKDGTVLYVKEDAEWHPEAAKEIPAGELLIVADDAHRFDFLDKLLLLARSLRQRQRVKVVLGTRPSGVDQIDAMLALRFAAAEISRFPRLEKMSQQGVRELAVEVLGAGHTQHAPALAVVSADTPLVTVLGGRLIAKGEISPALLANEEAFRHEVFNKFSAEYERLLPAGAVNWRTLLNLVAAVSPVSPSANQFVEPAAEILRIRPDEVRSALDLLEKRGLLLRGGRLIRIVPDLLSDFLLEGACLTGAGESTGFSDLMFQTFQSTYLSNLLRNLGELDWRITQRNPDQGTRLLDGIWLEIGRGFDAGDASVRVQLFKSLTGAALFQPARVLQLIRRAIGNEAAEVRVWSDFALTQEHVLREIPPLLRGISHHFNHIEDAAEILWRLAKSDSRAPHQYPDHSRRVLEEMADYGRYKPVQFNDWMADFAARKSRDPREFEGTFTPLSIVDKLLEKEGDFTESEGHTISIGTFGLNHAVVRPVREKALGIVDACLNSENPKIALRATESIARVLSGFLPSGVRQITDDEAKWQMDERLAALGIVENRLKKETPTPLLRQLRSVLRRARPRVKDNPLVGRIDALIASIPQSDDLVIFDAFSTAEWDHDVFYETIEEGERSRRELVSRGVAAFQKKFPDGRRRVDGIVELVRDAEACGINLGNQPYSFIEELCSEDFVQAYLPYAMNDPHPLLAQMIMVPLRWLR